MAKPKSDKPPQPRPDGAPQFAEAYVSESTRPSDAAFRQLVRVYGLLGRVMHPYFARHGISGSQWGVLRTLYRAEQEGDTLVRLTDLSERLIVRPPSLTGVIDRLVRMGLVGRGTSERDRREKPVHLTAEGRTLVAKILEKHDQKIDTLLAGLNEAEQQKLQTLLGRLGTHLQILADAEGGEDIEIDDGNP
jgi:DNA-binding MarR family transcriptional regulator